MDAQSVGKITLEGREMDIPDGIEAIGDSDLYSVDIGLLSYKEGCDDSDVYEWANPRHLGKNDQAPGKGFTKDEMRELLDSIRDEGLYYSLICRWIVKDGKLCVQVIDGERRFRCIERLYDRNESVWDRSDRNFQPAKTVYNKVPCRIIVGNDKEALKVAFTVSDRAVGWGEGATTKLVQKLRSTNCTDQEILELLNKSSQWLMEQDRLCSLDEATFNALTNGRINRAVALELAKVEDVSKRVKYLEATIADAINCHQEVVAKANVDLEKAIDKEEIAESELEEAKNNDAPAEVLTTLAEKVEETKAKVEEKAQAKAEARRPIGKGKNLRRGAAVVDGAAGDSDINKPLRPGKVRKQLETVQALIAKDGKEEDDKELVSVTILHAVEAVLLAVVNGEEDIVSVLRRYKQKQILMNRKK